MFSERLASYAYTRRRLKALPASGNAAEDALITNAMIAAEGLLARTPAVTTSDLRAKVEALWGNPRADLQWEDLAHVLADLRRLTGDEPSRVFDAQTWLDDFGRVNGMWIVRDGEVILLAPADAADLMAELDACGGGGAVKALISAQQVALARGGVATDELQRLIDRHEAARCALNTAAASRRDDEYDRLERDFSAALHALDNYEPRTSSEFVRAIAARYGEPDSIPTDDQMAAIVSIARKLGGE